MLELALRDEFKGERLKGTTIDFSADKPTSALQRSAAEFLNITYPSVDLLRVFEATQPIVLPKGGRMTASDKMKLVWSSHRDDVTLGNPFGPFAHGWTQVVATMERAASFYKDGMVLGFETVSKYETPDLAYTVEIERYKASIGGKDAAVVALRCTSIFRRENGTWKLVHRHADPITTVRPPESAVGK